MSKRAKHSLLLVAALLVCLGAVATGTAMPQRRAPQGYARLLQRKARLLPAQNTLMAECLMEQTRLRQQAGNQPIPEARFEELRQFCRAAARVESQHQNDTPASVERETARQQILQRHRQALDQLATSGQ